MGAEENNFISDNEINKYAEVSFITEDTKKWKVVDLSDPCNIDLKNIFNDEWEGIVKIILWARLGVFSSNFIFDWDRIVIPSKHWVDTHDLELWVNNLFNDEELENRIIKIWWNKKVLTSYLLDFQKTICSDDFINKIFDDILRLWNVSFLVRAFDSHIENIWGIDFKGWKISSAINKINSTWKKIGKDNLFNDFKKSLINNIVQIAYKKWYINNSANNIYNNQPILNLKKLASNKWLSVKILPEALDVYLPWIDLNFSSNLDKMIKSIFDEKNWFNQKKIEKIIVEFSNIKNISISYQSFINMYKNFYLKTISDINKWIELKKNKINSIIKDEGDLLEAKKELSVLINEKEEIKKEYALMDSTWESRHNHITRDGNILNITKKKCYIKDKEFSIENKKKSLENYVISKSEFKRLKDFIELKEGIEKLLESRVLKKVA